MVHREHAQRLAQSIHDRGRLHGTRAGGEDDRTGLAAAEHRMRFHVVDAVLQRLIGESYIRLQTRLDEASDDLDDASPENLAALRREAEQLITQRSADIDRLCGLVT